MWVEDEDKRGCIRDNGKVKGFIFVYRCKRCGETKVLKVKA
jgi:hypothetical protein